MNNMKISSKISILLAVALAVGACSSTFLIFRLQGLTTTYEALIDALRRQVGQQDSARQMQVTFKKEVQAWKDILIRGSDPAKLQKYSDEFHAQASKVRDTAATLKREESDTGIRGLIEQFGQSHADLGNKYDAGLQAFVQSAGLNVQDADNMVAGLDRIPTDLVDKIVEQAIQRTDAQRASQISSQKEAVAREIRQVSAVLIVAFAGIGWAAIFTTRRISAALRLAISELSEGAERVAAAATQVFSSSQALAAGSSEQAASLEETSASSEEINSMARRNGENSRGAADLVTQSQQKFIQTNQSLDQMVVAIGEINAQSGKISKIIRVIDEIAFQTNILALNAAVEAARAGEAGTGFAVVADEVRNLAQRCAQAARDTAVLIEESIDKSNEGKVRVDQVATAILTITAESARVKTLVDEVNLGSEEQTRGIGQIGKAITQMEQVTHKTAASAGESASAAGELSAESARLTEIVERLKDMVGGGEAANGHTRAVHRPPVAVRGKTPESHNSRESDSSLTALRKIVSRRTKSAEHEEPILAVRGVSGEAFPLDEQFREF